MSLRQVTLAFCKSASIAQQSVNCLSEILFDHALLTSAKIDATYRATGVPAGPLHGLPISLKDCFQVAGVDATIGYTAYADHPASEEDESELTRILRASGAVVFCKTNVPLAMMSGEVRTLSNLDRRRRRRRSGHADDGRRTIISTAIRRTPTIAS